MSLTLQMAVRFMCGGALLVIIHICNYCFLL